jgi:hypothetical protein
MQADCTLRFYFKGNRYSDLYLDIAVFGILSYFKGRKQKRIRDVRSALEGAGFYVWADEFPTNEAQKEFIISVLGKIKHRAIDKHCVDSLTCEYIRDEDGHE